MPGARRRAYARRGLAAAGLLAVLRHGVAYAQAAPPEVPPPSASAPAQASAQRSAQPSAQPSVQPSAQTSASAGQVALRFSGYVQADAVVHRQSSEDEVSPSGEPLNRDRFVIPRSRFRVDAERAWVSAVFEVDGATQSGATQSGATLRLAEASVSLTWQGPDAAGPPLLVGTIGLFKIPFGFEVGERDTQRLFLERTSGSRALFPGTYDVGARLVGGHRFLRYAIALMNGEPTTERSYPAQDPNKAKDLVGRLGLEAPVTDAVRVRAGVSALSGTGFHRGNAATKDVIVWRDANEDGLVQLTELQVIPGSAATPSESFFRFALGADLGVTARLPVVGELVVFGEIVRAGNLDRGDRPADPVASGRQLRELGFGAGVTQELTRYAIVGVRYDRYDPDADASEQRGVRRVPRSSAVSTLAVTGGLRYPPGRLLFEYDRNANALGRTPGGLPTSLADDAFTVRAEVVF